MVAYVWRGGLIEFGDKCPAGARQIASGEATYLRPIVETLARHAYEPGQLLVPGVAEAEGDDGLAIKAVATFAARVHLRLRKAA